MEEAKKGNMDEKNVRQRELSDMDKLYQELYGEEFAKAGTAYERLTAAAISYLSQYPALYNQFIEGISGERKQVDGILKTPEGDVMIEAKDYGRRNAKVAYEDIAKLEGSLTDMNMVGGILASATDFTEPTKQYAKGTRNNERQSPITLYDIRRPMEEDKKNRIANIQINLNITYLDFTPQCFVVQYTKEGMEQLKQDLSKQGAGNADIKASTTVFYDFQGNEKISLDKIFQDLNDMVKDDSSQIMLSGVYPLDDCFVKYKNKLYAITGLAYKVPILRGRMTSEIKGGKPVLLVKSDDGRYDKILSDDELKSIRFEDGKVILTE